jgi:hypothetical protein
MDMRVSDRIGLEWTEDHRRGWGRQVLLAKHSLQDSPLFSDQGLAELFDRFPRNRMKVYTMGHDVTDFRSFHRGVIPDISGLELLETIKRGRLWLNLRQVDSLDPAIGDLCAQMFARLEAAQPGLRTFKRDLGLLISSPNAQVFYHLDVPLVTLWQIRGVKRVWVYPARAPFISEQALEQIVLKETEEEFDFNPSFDADAEVYDLEPGQMVTWPQNAPHRVVNHGMLNVSLSVEFMTLPAIVRANAIYANGVLRRRWGLKPSIGADYGERSYLKAGLARVLKATRSGQAYVKAIPTTFRVDPTAELGFVRLNEAR